MTEYMVKNTDFGMNRTSWALDRRTVASRAAGLRQTAVVVTSPTLVGLMLQMRREGNILTREERN